MYWCHNVIVIVVGVGSLTGEAAAMSTKMVISQPKPFMVTSPYNQWSSGICDCFQDLPQCCLAFWCLPCFACKTSYEANECLCLPLLDACGLIPPITLSLRVSVRQRYGIEDTVCNDCIYACCCGPCTWCQMAREIKTRTSPITIINSSPSWHGTANSNR